ncbi:MAG: tyrosinase family protein, partial [Planctomycetota bacterium]
LPYWNWNQNNAIHSAFLNASSPLFHSRNNTTMAGVSAVSTATLDPIFADTNFFSFSSQIEGSPHNLTHVIVGSTMVTGGSPLDPIFWAHHCMVDYCWAKWNIQLGNDNTNDQTWNDTSWNHFVDGTGNPVNVTAGLTTLMPLLSYQYEPSAVGNTPAARVAKATEDYKTLEKRIRAGADIKFDVRKRVAIAERASVRIAAPLTRETKLSPASISALIDSDAAKETIFASVEYAHYPPECDFYLRVFINRPGASGETPTSDAHYAGSFAFFGTHSPGRAGHHHRPKFLVNVTPTLQRLKKAGKLAADRPISVQLVPVAVGKQFAKPDAELKLEKIELLVTPVIVRSR